MNRLGYTLPINGGTAQRERHEDEINRNLNVLASRVAALPTGARMVGAWDAGSGNFPTTRPDSSAIQNGDSWFVNEGGTVDGQAFLKGDRLIALAAGGGATYAGNWLRAGFADLLEGLELSHYATVGAFLDDTAPSRGTGSLWSADGARFREAAPSASDADVENAAGVPFYVRPTPDGGYNYSHFGIVAQATGQTPKIAAMMEAAVELARPIWVTAQLWVEEDIELDNAVRLRGNVSRSRDSAGIEMRDGFRMFNGATLKANAPGTSALMMEFINLHFVDGADTAIPADRQSMLPGPLVQIGRANFLNMQGCWFDGQNRRLVGFYPGRGDSLWQSEIGFSKFTQCGVGAILGDDKDFTDLSVFNCTFDHNIIAGCVATNPHAGWFAVNSFENNLAPVGLYLRSLAGSAGYRARPFNIWCNYAFNNNRRPDWGGFNPTGVADWMIGDPGREGSAAIVIGGPELPLVGSDFITPGVLEIVSTNVPWGGTIMGNYAVSGFTERAITAQGSRGMAILYNTVQSAQTTAPHRHIKLVGTSAAVYVQGNYAQNDGFEDRVEASQGYRIPLWRNPGNGADVAASTVDFQESPLVVPQLTVGSRLSVGGPTVFQSSATAYSNRTYEGLLAFGPGAPGGELAGGDWRDIFDLNDTSIAPSAYFSASFQIHIERTDQSQASEHWLDVRRTADGGEIVSHRFGPASMFSGREFRMSGNKLQVKNNLAIALLGTVRAVGSPFG